MYRIRLPPWWFQLSLEASFSLDLVAALDFSVFDFEGMAPKAIQVYPVQGYFSHFSRWYNDEDFVGMLSGGLQAEPVTLWDLFARRPLPFYLHKLFPAVGPTFYTQLEMAVLTTVQFIVFTVPTSLPPPELFANFMVYMTLPEKLCMRIFAPVVSGHGRQKLCAHYFEGSGCSLVWGLFESLLYAEVCFPDVHF